MLLEIRASNFPVKEKNNTEFTRIWTSLLKNQNADSAC